MSVTVEQWKIWSADAQAQKNQDTLTLIITSVNEWVGALPVVADVNDWPPDVTLGALMLATRWLRRQGTPNGIESMTDAGVAYTASRDPDLDKLLHINSWAKPIVG